MQGLFSSPSNTACGRLALLMRSGQSDEKGGTQNWRASGAADNTARPIDPRQQTPRPVTPTDKTHAQCRYNARCMHNASLLAVRNGVCRTKTTEYSGKKTHETASFLCACACRGWMLNEWTTARAVRKRASLPLWVKQLPLASSLSLLLKVYHLYH